MHTCRLCAAAAAAAAAAADAHMQVVAGVAGYDHRQPLLSWKLPRDMDRGCVGVGFELEVTRDV